MEITGNLKLKDMSLTIWDSDIFKYRYYVFGLAIQKGTPFLVIPLVLWGFGDAAYANYVIIYSITQFAALAISLGTVNALMVFWNNFEDKGIYIRSLIILIILLSTILSIPLLVGLYFYPMFNYEKQSLLSGFIALLIVIYSIIYNINVAGLGVIRMIERQKIYFALTFISSAFLVILLTFLGYSGHHYNNNTIELTIIYIVALALQTYLVFLLSPIKAWKGKILNDYKVFVVKILNYSIPHMFYVLMTLSVITLDKIIVKMNFEKEIFIQYTLDYQTAYAVNLVSIVISMYALPLFCKLVNGGESELREKILSQFKLSLIGSFFVAILMYCYAMSTGVNLSIGYWLLAVAFGFMNMFTINIGVMEAYKRGHELAVKFALIPCVVFWILFGIVMYIKIIMFIYILIVVYTISLFLLSTYTVLKYTNISNIKVA